MENVFINCNDEKFNDVMLIRNAVFEAEQGAIEDEEIDKYDSNVATLYLLVYDGSKPCATGRIAHTEKGVKIGRIAVMKSQRGKGTGRLLVNMLINKARDMGAGDVYVDAQLHAIPFYEVLGFIPTGEAEIIDRGIRHLPMVNRYEKE